MKRIASVVALTTIVVGALATSAGAYQIYGKYASLNSCEYVWSDVRGEFGYTGIYEVMGEYWSVYFGRSYCQS